MCVLLEFEEYEEFWFWGEVAGQIVWISRENLIQLPLVFFPSSQNPFYPAVENKKILQCLFTVQRVAEPFSDFSSGRETRQNI